MTGFEVYGDAGAYVITREGNGRIEGCFYAQPDNPQWWRGHARGVVREIYVPGGDANPAHVAARFLRVDARTVTAVSGQPDDPISVSPSVHDGEEGCR